LKIFLSLVNELDDLETKEEELREVADHVANCSNLMAVREGHNQEGNEEKEDVER